MANKDTIAGRLAIFLDNWAKVTQDPGHRTKVQDRILRETLH